MRFDIQTLRIFLVYLLQSPKKTMAEFARRLILPFKVPAQVTRLREITGEIPLLLQIETINTCNAACIFCAYPGMKRKKGVMSLSLFEKIVKEFAEMGGISVSLTPIVGDALLDPHLLERLRILKRYPAIKQITFTTNGIALDRHSDEEVRFLLETVYCLQVSIGGLDAASYEMMYGVDRFTQVRQAMERLMTIKETVPKPANITFAFRTNDWKFEARFKELLETYRKSGVFVSSMWAYANFAGAVKKDEKRHLVVVESAGRKRKTCVSPSMSMGICWDGTITACSCVDFEGDKLRIGEAERDPLAAVWRGGKRAAILSSFGKGKLFPICRGCSAYTPDTVFANDCFKGIYPLQPIPLDFFHNMMT